MTRFARAKGSKASNERLPEQATSWGEMKQQMLDKNKDIEDSKKRKVAEKKRMENYKTFLEEVEESKSNDVKWAEFPEAVSKKVKKTSEIVNNNEHDVDEGDDGPPEETSAKVAEAEIKVIKKKVKKKPLKIIVEKTATANSDEVDMQKNNVEVTKNPGQNVNGKKFKKRKLDDDKLNTKNKKVKKAADELTEQDLKKIEKKKQKRLKQLEKKKLNKAEQKNEVQESNENLNKPSKKFEENTNNGPQKKPENPNKPFKKFEKNTNKPFSGPQKKTKHDVKPERRKKFEEKMMINGKEVNIAYYDGFPIKKEDAERIIKLRKEMISRGLPRSEIRTALKLERRKAEKAFTREKKKVCFNCRKSGHNLSECPELGKSQLTESTATGICFKCGSTEHTHFECKVVRGQEFKFAQCFICNEQGHIARQCPDNARGLYPKGGACKVCGDVTHLKKDCPKYQAQQQQEESMLNIETFDGGNPDSLDDNSENSRVKMPKRQNKIVKF